MAQVYLETSFISACVTNRTDPASVYPRQISQEWWNTPARLHALFTSAEGIAELSHPQSPLSRQAFDWVRNVPLLPIGEEVRGLASILVREKVMPGPVAGDAVHLAVASVHGMDYMLTWNVRHLANPNNLEHLRVVCLRAGIIPPGIVPLISSGSWMMSQPEGHKECLDPLIDEVRRVRKSLSDRFDNDVGKLCDYLQHIKEQQRDRLVDRARDLKSPSTPSFRR